MKKFQSKKDAKPTPFGLYLREMRRIEDLTIAEAAKLITVGAGNLSNVETGSKRIISKKKWDKILEVYPRATLEDLTQREIESQPLLISKTEYNHLLKRIALLEHLLRDRRQNNKAGG